MRPSLVALVAVLACVFADSAYAANQTVVASSNVFTERDVQVYPGETVTWTNSGGMHNVHFDTLSFDEPVDPVFPWVDPVQRRFDEAPGVYRYECDLHGPAMFGTVEVLAPPGTPPGQPPPGTPPPGGTPTPPPGGGEPGGSDDPFKVTLKAGDRTPLVGKRFGLSGTVTPARDGRQLQIQRRLGGGKWTTIARVRLKDAGSARSKFSLRLKLAADAVLRARLSGDDERDTGLSQRLRIDVHR
jgi:plastocyanin